MAERKTTKSAASEKAAPEKTTDTTEQQSAGTATTKAARTMAAADTGPAETSSSGTDTSAAPMAAPEAKPRKLGNPDSSTNFVAANAALRSVPGSHHLRLHDGQGGALDPETLFEFPPSESPSLLATVKQQVHEEFTYPNASTPTSQLMFPAGARIPVERAVQLRDALRAQAEEPAPEPWTSA